MSKETQFRWGLKEPLPLIKAHTDCKLSVIEQYLDIYFDTVTANHRIETLNITLVDGFCGGGLYNAGNETRFGSPFVLLYAVEKAKNRINLKRIKPLNIIAHYYFSDLDIEHVAVLRDQLSKSEFSEQLGNNIILQVGRFEELLPNIVSDIKKRQTKGRSIFILDQWGYINVSVKSLQHIFMNLERPEIILTFSIDSLLNYLREDGSGLENLQQFGVTKEFVSSWQSLKDDNSFGRATAQRVIMENINRYSGAYFFTPFMMFSPTDNRWMLLAHLSKHQAARDKMLLVHWDKKNVFKHIGKGSLFELGFDHRLIEQNKDSLFSFKDEDETNLITELENELPNKVISYMKHGSLPVKELLSLIGNQTAAPNHTIFSILRNLAIEGDFEVLKKDGGKKKKVQWLVYLIPLFVQTNLLSNFKWMLIPNFR